MVEYTHSLLTKPSSCVGCPLYLHSSGFSVPALAGTEKYGVALLSESLDSQDPWADRTGFRLGRLLEWAGFKREGFDLYASIWCRPHVPLEAYEHAEGAIQHCRTNHWQPLLSRAKVIVPMGNVALKTLLNKHGILAYRGYIEGLNGHYVVPTVSPVFIQRGQAKYSAAFINDIQKAVKLAAEGRPPQVLNYVLDPTPIEAMAWVSRYLDRLQRDPGTYLAFDIETPWKGDDESEADTDSDAPDISWNIERIGFSFEPLGALSIPWAPEYLPAVRALLGGGGPKVVWNAGFDVPRVRRAGIPIGGIIHDGMVAWHILHTDLPKSLGFVATFTCPYQPAWKHLSGSQPAFYNATDADVELRSMLEIERELRRTGLWSVYERDVIELDPILVHMHAAGMPIDSEIRLDRATKLASRQADVYARLEAAVPKAARRIDIVYKKRPRDISGLEARPGTRQVRRCAACGLESPRKDHFKRFVKKVNPCADAGTNTTTEDALEYYRLSEFKPSRDQLIRYHHWINRPLPMTWNKKAGKRTVSFGEKQVKELCIRYGHDPIYPAILEYRRLDKIAGTYIGRPSCE